mgnify:CR=1 FL=1
MILGLQLTWMHLIIGGAATGLLIAFQVLVGARKIKFKGRLHMKVHKWGGWVLLGFGVVHGFLALALYNGWKIL